MPKTFTLSITCGNQAFQPDVRAARHEVANILSRVGQDLLKADDDEVLQGVIYDHNGGRVGDWKLNLEG